MNVSCIRSPDNINPEFADLIVFPEYCYRQSIEEAAAVYPASIMAGAAEKDGKSVGFIYHHGKLMLSYDKLKTDGPTTGSANTSQNPFYETGDTFIGLLVCMDLQHATFSKKIIETVLASNCLYKIVCIPAAMSSTDWFSSDSMLERFNGMHVILSNNDSYKVRCDNFVTDTNGKKIISQLDDIYIKLNLGIYNE